MEESLGEAIPLAKLGGLTAASSGHWDWKWKVDFTWGNQRYGPWEFDVKGPVDEFAQSELGSSIRLLLLFYIGTVFLFAVFGLFFDAP